MREVLNISYSNQSSKNNAAEQPVEEGTELNSLEDIQHFTQWKNKTKRRKLQSSSNNDLSPYPHFFVLKSADVHQFISSG